MHFKGQKAMGTNALFNHKKTHSIQCKAEEGAQAPRSKRSEDCFEELLQTGLRFCSALPLPGEVGRSKRWRRLAVLSKNELPFSQEQ